MLKTPSTKSKFGSKMLLGEKKPISSIPEMQSEDWIKVEYSEALKFGLSSSLENAALAILFYCIEKMALAEKLNFYKDKILHQIFPNNEVFSDNVSKFDLSLKQLQEEGNYSNKLLAIFNENIDKIFSEFIEKLNPHKKGEEGKTIDDKDVKLLSKRFGVNLIFFLRDETIRKKTHNSIFTFPIKVRLYLRDRNCFLLYEREKYSAGLIPKISYSNSHISKILFIQNMSKIINEMDNSNKAMEMEIEYLKERREKEKISKDEDRKKSQENKQLEIDNQVIVKLRMNAMQNFVDTYLSREKQDEERKSLTEQFEQLEKDVKCIIEEIQPVSLKKFSNPTFPSFTHNRKCKNCLRKDRPLLQCSDCCFEKCDLRLCLRCFYLCLIPIFNKHKKLMCPNCFAIIKSTPLKELFVKELPDLYEKFPIYD